MGILRSLASTRQGAAALALLAAGVAPPAGATTSGTVLEVTVLPDRYLTAEVAFTDLDALQALVEAARPALLKLDACGGDAVRPTLAAAERLRDYRLALRLLPDTDAACTASAGARIVQASQVAPPRRPARPGPTGEAYWQTVMP